MQNARVRGLLAALLACVVVHAAPAATYTWSGGSSGAGDAWRQANNWSPSAPQSGPVSGDVAVFGTNGSAVSIGINFNDGRGLTNPVAAIVLTNGPDRAVFNSAPNSAGTIKIEGAQGLLLANYSASSDLSLRNGAASALRIDLTAGGVIHVAAPAASVTLDGAVGGSHGFSKTGAGLLRLTHSNSLTGTVHVAGGTLQLASSSGSSLGAVSALRLGSGAVAELVSTRQLGATTGLDLDGGTLRGATGPVALPEHAGTLTLSASSTIDVRAAAIHFADSTSITWDSSATLTIANWRTVPGGGLFFGVGGLTSNQLAQIYFADLGVYGAQLVGPQGELTPIPEAPVVAGAVALVGLIIWRERRRWKRWFARPLRASTGKESNRLLSLVSLLTECLPRG